MCKIVTCDSIYFLRDLDRKLVKPSEKWFCACWIAQPVISKSPYVVVHQLSIFVSRDKQIVYVQVIAYWPDYLSFTRVLMVSMATKLYIIHIPPDLLWGQLPSQEKGGVSDLLVKGYGRLNKSMYWCPEHFVHYRHHNILHLLEYHATISNFCHFGLWEEKLFDNDNYMRVTWWYKFLWNKVLWYKYAPWYNQSCVFTILFSVIFILL